MTFPIVLQVLLRLLPSVILFVTAYFVVKDESMRRRWTDLLFKAGSIRSGQREDAKIQSGIRIPFLVLGVLFLVWPVMYMFRDSYQQKPVEIAPPTVPLLKTPPTPVPAATAAQPAVPPPPQIQSNPMPGQPGSPAAPSAPAPAPATGAAPLNSDNAPVQLAPRR